MTRVLSAAVVATLLLVSGCAAAEPPTAQTAPPAEPQSTASQYTAAEPELVDACAVLPQHEAEAIAQTPLEEGVPGDPAHPSCLYPGPVDGPLAQVEIFIGDGAEKFYEIERTLEHQLVELPGIGDEAYSYENTLFARTGATWVALRLVRLNDPAENADALASALSTIVDRVR